MQAIAYQWLGRWYEDIDLDYQKAQHCYERAIQIDDDDIIAGIAAVSLLCCGTAALKCILLQPADVLVTHWVELLKSRAVAS